MQNVEGTACRRGHAHLGRSDPMARWQNVCEVLKLVGMRVVRWSSEHRLASLVLVLVLVVAVAVRGGGRQVAAGCGNLELRTD